jgi:ferredoxin-thioredoxin reductase catalytic chain
VGRGWGIITATDAKEVGMEQPKQQSIDKMWNYAEKFAGKSGTHLHPDRSITEVVVLGLAANTDSHGRPLCPCNFYPPKNPDGTWQRTSTCQKRKR